MPSAVYIPEVSWDGQNIGQFVIGTSVLSGTDTFGQSFESRFDGPYDNLTGYVNAVAWGRGRASPAGAMSDGTGRLTLKDRYGLFNPRNPGSPLAGKLKPLRPVRLRAIYDGVEHGCFYHFIRSIQHNPDPNVRETVIETVDLFQWLRQAKPVLAAAGIENAGHAIGRVLDAIYWTEPGLRDLARGDDLPAWDADGSQDALDLIASFLLATDPGGMFFHAGSGKATYKSRHTLLLQSVAATFAGTMTAALPGTTLDTVENRAHVTRTGGAEQTVTNPVSAHDYAIRDGAKLESPLLHNDDHARSLAAELTRRSGSPDEPLWDMRVMSGDHDRLVQILTRELGDRVTVTEAGGGSDGGYVLQQMSHTVDHGMKVHTASYGMTLYDAQSPFVIGSSLLDSADQLIY